MVVLQGNPPQIPLIQICPNMYTPEVQLTKQRMVFRMNLDPTNGKSLVDDWTSWV